MLGNSDAQQLSMQLVHRFAKQRPEMNTTEDWGLYSPQAESHLQSVMGLQTLNCVRSLDFLLSLPEVDPEKVAMTGASGGGNTTNNTTDYTVTFINYGATYCTRCTTDSGTFRSLTPSFLFSRGTSCTA